MSWTYMFHGTRAITKAYVQFVHSVYQTSSDYFNLKKAKFLGLPAK